MNRDTKAVLDYWKTLGPAGWFAKDEKTDAEITRRFARVHSQATSGMLHGWQGEPAGSLAYVIVLDQFSRNMFRKDPSAFASDELALAAANQAVSRGFHLSLKGDMAHFFFMPFMHSESILDQHRCVALMHAFSSAQSLKFAILHRQIIKRFGRFPHRNQVLGRASSEAEIAFLAAGGFAG